MAVPASEVRDLRDMLGALRDGRPRTRADLADVLGRGRAVVDARLDVLRRTGLVESVGEAESTGGRPAERFAFSGPSRYVVAVDLGVTHLHLAITDLSSTILAERLEPSTIESGPDVVLGRVVELAGELVASTGRPRSAIAGIGIGVPGPVEHLTGRPMSPPLMPGWNGIDIVGKLSAKLCGAAVLVDNDVNVMALGEHAGAYPGVDHLLFVKIASGIGSGMISGGSLLRGSDGAAGDIGHIWVPGSSAVCRCGNVGCLEAVAGGWALVDQLAAQGLGVSTPADIVALARAGNGQVAVRLRAAGRDVGQVLASCVNMLNPSVVVIGGELAEAGENLLAGIREAVYGRSLPLATQHLRIVPSRVRAQAGVLGASTMVVDHLLSEAGLVHAFLG